MTSKLTGTATAVAGTAAPTLSFELMPPRTEKGAETFWGAVTQFERTVPDFVSVTYGAGGHNRGTAHEVTARLVRNSPVRPLAHLTCVSATRAETTAVVDQYLASGVRAFLALRGDRPREGGIKAPDELRSSIELIALLQARDRLRGEQSPSNALRAAANPLIIAVATFPAGNPAAETTPTQEVERLLIKQAAGASFAITQLFYDPQIYFDFVSEARGAGVHIPILPGILPPTNARRLRRVAELLGVEPDPQLLRQLEDAEPEAATDIGVAAGAQLVQDVLDAGAPGIHIYTFNQPQTVLEVLARAGVIGYATPPQWLPSRREWPAPPASAGSQKA